MNDISRREVPPCTHGYGGYTEEEFCCLCREAEEKANEEYIDALRARLARLEEVLREIADGECDCSHTVTAGSFRYHYDGCRVLPKNIKAAARAALAAAESRCEEVKRERDEFARAEDRERTRAECALVEVARLEEVARYARHNERCHIWDIRAPACTCGPAADLKALHGLAADEAEE